jgi:hypothetical protein
MKKFQFLLSGSGIGKRFTGNIVIHCLRLHAASKGVLVNEVSNGFISSLSYGHAIGHEPITENKQSVV